MNARSHDSNTLNSIQQLDKDEGLVNNTSLDKAVEIEMIDDDEDL